MGGIMAAAYDHQVGIRPKPRQQGLSRCLMVRLRIQRMIPRQHDPVGSLAVALMGRAYP
jgi:hypothetical protein